VELGKEGMHKLPRQLPQVNLDNTSKQLIKYRDEQTQAMDGKFINFLPMGINANSMMMGGKKA
jgi:hypothetical protein